MNILFVLTDAPAANERMYQAMRLATELASAGEDAVRVFLVGDGVTCALPGAGGGKYDLGWTIQRFASGGNAVAACKTCLEQRGITPGTLVEGVRVGTLAQLAAWTRESERVLTF